MVYLGWSLFAGRKASANPFDATGLEWTTPSPPSTYNFERPPAVPERVYDYDPNSPLRSAA
jgi:cytochrome c oxidase subunit 1